MCIVYAHVCVCVCVCVCVRDISFIRDARIVGFLKGYEDDEVIAAVEVSRVGRVSKVITVSSSIRL